MVKFKYNNKVYQTKNLETKLKCLGITENEIEILNDSNKEPEEGISKRYYYRNINNGHVLISIFPELEESLVPFIGNLSDWQIFND